MTKTNDTPISRLRSMGSLVKESERTKGLMQMIWRKSVTGMVYLTDEAESVWVTKARRMRNMMTKCTIAVEQNNMVERTNRVGVTKSTKMVK